MVTHRRHLLTPALGAGLLVVVALVTTSGNLGAAGNPVPTGWTDVILILAGGCAAAALIVRRHTGGGTLSFGLFAAVAVLTALSIAWSVAPDQSWEESGRTVAYLAVFGIGLIGARASGADSRTAVLAVTLGAVALCVWALAVKSLDLNLYSQPAYGPLMAPFGYWNATGVTGAMALPGLIWIAGRRGGGRLIRGLGVAGIAVAASVVVLTYSRSAVAAALCATIIPLCVLRARRRAVVMLTLGVLGAVPICLVALTNHNIAGDTAGSIYGQTALHIHRGGAGLLLGLIIIVVAVVLTAAAAVLSGYADRTVQPDAGVVWFDRGCLAAVSAVPVAVVAWLLVNSRGPFGEISHVWHALTSVKGAPVGGTASRLGDVANSRSAYWRQALSVGEHHLLSGTGAGTFNPAHLRYGTATLTPGQDVKQAHSYVMETFADFGLVGVVLNAGLFAVWCRDARRTLATARTAVAAATTPPAPGATATTTPTTAAAAAAAAAAEYDARWALMGVVIAFGVSSALDYTWFFPGVAIPALVAAGWIAGLAAPRRSAEAQLAPAGPVRPAGAPRRPLTTHPGAIIALTLLAVLTLAVAWESLAPVRSIQSENAALNALVAENPAAALSDARSAVSQDPLSANALERLGLVDGALGRPAAERAELIRATQVQPENPQPLATLGSYLECSARDDTAALAPLRRATMLDITDTYSQTELLSAAEAHTHPAGLCAQV